MGIFDNVDKYVGEAVAHYWRTRRLQRERQKKRGANDAGLRSAVTGKAQMDGFINLFTQLIIEAGINEENIFYKRSLELPGFFRPTKEWDLLVIKDGQLSEKGAFNGGKQPFLGYFFMLEDCEASNKPVRVKEPHFKAFSEFIGASYMKRYEIFCRKLVLERHYTASSFIVSDSSRGEDGIYREPASDLAFTNFAKILRSHVRSFI